MVPARNIRTSDPEEDAEEDPEEDAEEQEPLWEREPVAPKKKKLKKRKKHRGIGKSSENEAFSSEKRDVQAYLSLACKF